MARADKLAVGNGLFCSKSCRSSAIRAGYRAGALSREFV
jgi:hypothetical protein